MMQRVMATGLVLMAMAGQLWAADTAPASQAAPRTKPPAVGEKAPELALMTLDGKKVELAESVKKGPVVVIQLRGWVGYQCPFCTQQTNDLITNSKAILAKASQVIFVYPGPADGLKEHAQEFIGGKGLPEGYAFVVDPGMSFVNQWGLHWNKTAETAFPSTFIVDKEGVVRFAKVSSTHGDRASAADIMKALGEIK